MKSHEALHKAQVSILQTLRYATRARYSELLHPTGLASDIFKYHLRTLVRQKYVAKANDGSYELTAEGKEFANLLDKRTGREIERPKASVLLVVRTTINGQTHYLAHKRTREPFYDFWGIASAPVLRGVPIHDSAARELKKQAGIVADFHVVGQHRIIDTRPNGTVLEDKLLTLMVADVAAAPTPHVWHGGHSQWMTRDELLAKERLFPTTAKTLDMVECGVLFAEDICVYSADEY